MDFYSIFFVFFFSLHVWGWWDENVLRQKKLYIIISFFFSLSSAASAIGCRAQSSSSLFRFASNFHDRFFCSRCRLVALRRQGMSFINWEQNPPREDIGNRQTFFRSIQCAHTLYTSPPSTMRTMICTCDFFFDPCVSVGVRVRNRRKRKHSLENDTRRLTGGICNRRSTAFDTWRDE